MRRYELMRGPPCQMRDVSTLSSQTRTEAVGQSELSTSSLRDSSPRWSHRLAPNSSAYTHSFRIWLACALLAANATPDQIMIMLRWSSDTVRRLYARLRDSTQTQLLSRAQQTDIDSVRSHSLLATGAGAFASTAVPFGRGGSQFEQPAHTAPHPAAVPAQQARAVADAAAAVQPAADLLHRAQTAAAGARLRGEALRAARVVIDDDDAMT